MPAPVVAAKVESDGNYGATERGPAGVWIVCLGTATKVDSRAIKRFSDIQAEQMSDRRERTKARKAKCNFLRDSPLMLEGSRYWSCLAVRTC
jgi:hypothetical protein